jgi:acetyl esterase/lipase
MARTYDPALAAAIDEKTYVEEIDGLAIEMHPVPDDDRPHALDPRVWDLFQRRKRGEFPTPKGNDLIAMRTRPNKENHSFVDDVEHTVEIMDFGDRAIHLHLFARVDHDDYVAENGPVPVLVYIHGGGFSVGNVDMYIPGLEAIAHESHAVVAYPEYRLAPEAPFPAAVEDSVATVDWVARNADELGVDVDRLAVAGDSAGGSLCNAVCILLGKEAVKLNVQLYPCVDATDIPETWSLDLYDWLPEQEEAAQSRILRIAGSVDALADMYTRGYKALMLDPLVSATYYPRLDLFPRTVMIASEFDYLRVQDEEFARKLAAAGVPVRSIRALGCDHGFFEQGGHVPMAENVAHIISEELSAL